MKQFFRRLFKSEKPTLTRTQAQQHVINSLPGFGFTKCPEEVYRGFNDADTKLILEEYYDLHCCELGL